MAHDGNTIIQVFDVLGKKVSVLFDGMAKAGEMNKLDFNAVGYAPGIYFYRLTTDGRLKPKGWK